MLHHNNQTPSASSEPLSELRKAEVELNRLTQEFLIAEGRYFREQSVIARRAYAHAKKKWQSAVEARDAIAAKMPVAQVAA